MVVETRSCHSTRGWLDFVNWWTKLCLLWLVLNYEKKTKTMAMDTIIWYIVITVICMYVICTKITYRWCIHIKLRLGGSCEASTHGDSIWCLSWIYKHIFRQLIMTWWCLASQGTHSWCGDGSFWIVVPLWSHWSHHVSWAGTHHSHLLQHFHSSFTAENSCEWMTFGVKSARGPQMNTRKA